MYGVAMNITSDGGSNRSDVKAQARHPAPSVVQRTSTYGAGTLTNGANSSAAGNGYMNGMCDGPTATVAYGSWPASQARAPSRMISRSDASVRCDSRM